MRIFRRKGDSQTALVRLNFLVPIQHFQFFLHFPQGRNHTMWLQSAFKDGGIIAFSLPLVNGPRTLLGDNVTAATRETLDFIGRNRHFWGLKIF